MNGRGLHRGSTLLLSVAMVAIGVAVVVQSLAESASALAARLLIGILLTAAGVGRIYIEVRRGRER
jgi:uncharacterized membrane protein HdeD (DUF308 family)